MTDDTPPRPLTIEHGRALASGIRAAHIDVQATKEAAGEILALLSPHEHQPSPVLQILETMVEAQMRHTQALLGIERRLDRIERALQIGSR